MYIQRLKSNPYVIAMHPAAVMGYLWLVMAQWQSDDCSLPNDVRELRVISGLGMHWQEHAEDILSRFHSIEGDRLRNQTCYELWMDAKARYEEAQLNYEFLRQKRSASGKYGAQVRKEKNQASAKQVLSKSQASAKQTSSKAQAKSSLTVTDTYTETEEKPSGENTPEPKSLHAKCHVLVNRYWHQFHSEDVLAPWDAAEGKQLQQLLSANPGLTEEGFKRLLDHRARSDVNHSQRPREWLARLTDYKRGPLDRFNQPKDSRNGTHNNRADDKLNNVKASYDAAQQRIRDMGFATASDAGDDDGSGAVRRGGSSAGNHGSGLSPTPAPVIDGNLRAHPAGMQVVPYDC